MPDDASQLDPSLYQSKTNIVRDILEQRATQLLREIENAGTIPHQQTVGELRESAIKASLRQILPTGFDVCSGFVTDAYNVVSPQLDIIVYQQGTIAPLFLHQDDAVIPYELLRIAIEIKSTLRLGENRKTLDQIKSQADALSLMQFSSFVPNRELPGNVQEAFSFSRPRPMFIIAHDNEIGLETLKELVASSPTLLGVFVIEKYCVMKSPDGAFVHQGPKTSIDRIILAWMHIFQTCIDQMQPMNIPPKTQTEIKEWAGENRPDIVDHAELFLRLQTPHLMPYIGGVQRPDVPG